MWKGGDAEALVKALKQRLERCTAFIEGYSHHELELHSYTAVHCRLPLISQVGQADVTWGTRGKCYSKGQG